MIRKIIVLALGLLCGFVVFNLLQLGDWFGVLEKAHQPAAVSSVQSKGAETSEVLESDPARESQKTTVLEADSVEALPQDTAVIEIPAEGYSVEDADYYFVPRAQRKPGNLGGPPPPAAAIPENEAGFRPVE